MAVDADAEGTTPSGWSLAPEPLYVAAYLAPWAALSLLLPGPHRVGALALLALLGGLLAAAGAWSRRRAEAAGLDGVAWSFAAVASLGLTMPVMLLWRPTREDAAGPTALCHDCGRLGSLHETFCFGCGAR